MKTNFTPGTWKGFIVGKPIVVSSNSISGPEICTVKGSGLNAVADFEERKANANLIAAAPEMYKELNILADCLKMVDPKLWAKEIKGIEELLKKARGES